MCSTDSMPNTWHTKAIISQLQQAIKYKILKKEPELSKASWKEENTIALDFSHVSEYNTQFG